MVYSEPPISLTRQNRPVRAEVPGFGRGSLAIDNLLIGHSGETVEDVGWFWDRAERRYRIAHDYTIASYVCTSGFRRFRKQEDGPDHFRHHTGLFKELVDWAVERTALHG